MSGDDELVIEQAPASFVRERALAMVAANLAPAPFIVAQRQAWFAWLGGLANLRHADEGQLSNTVDQLIAGTF